MAPGGAKYALFFSLLAAVCVWQSIVADSVPARIAWAIVAPSPAILAVAYIVNRPRLLGKCDSGKMAPAAHMVLLPYFLCNNLLLRLSRQLRVVQAPAQVAPNLWVGPKLFAADRSRVPKFAGVIDMTAEFEEASFMCDRPSYLCVPALDGTAPTSDQFLVAIKWGSKVAESGVLYVHCASGHSRSVAVAAGILVLRGVAGSSVEAVEIIRRARPRALPTPEQFRALDEALGRAGVSQLP